MPYFRSVYRKSFDEQVNFLVRKARRAHRLKDSDSDIRDMVFQSAVFRAGAATETYITLLIEAWLQKLKACGKDSCAPLSTNAFYASVRLRNAFAKYQLSGDERELLIYLQNEKDLWPLLAGNGTFPHFFEGKTLHSDTAYPSLKNLKKLFFRVGINNMTDRLSRNLSRDVENLIESFQGIRTALAHSFPPSITIGDVEVLLSDSKLLVGAIDRIFHGHVIKHGGSQCWPA